MNLTCVKFSLKFVLKNEETLLLNDFEIAVQIPPNILNFVQIFNIINIQKISLILAHRAASWLSTCIVVRHIQIKVKCKLGRYVPNIIFRMYFLFTCIIAY